MSFPAVLRRTPSYPDGTRLVLVTAVAFTLVAARFYFNPEQLAQTVVGGLLSSTAADLWNALFMIGGLAVAVGMLAKLPQLEALGCTLISIGCLVQAVVIIKVATTSPFYTVTLYGIFGLYFAARAAAIYRWVRSW